MDNNGEYAYGIFTHHFTCEAQQDGSRTRACCEQCYSFWRRRVRQRNKRVLKDAISDATILANASKHADALKTAERESAKFKAIIKKLNLKTECDWWMKEKEKGSRNAFKNGNFADPESRKLFHQVLISVE